MAGSISDILNVLSAYDIWPPAESYDDDLELPGIGEIEEGETVYATSLDEVLAGDGPFVLGTDDPRLREWWEQIESIIAGRESRGSPGERLRPEPPEPHCAWYCPIHFFGHGWGIYIRESCILSHAIDIARFVDWQAVKTRGIPANEIGRQLLRSAFYVFFLHEQFHHKVESLGFRFLVATGSDRYRPYKTKVYRSTYLTTDCLEESLANAESYRRLAEPRYAQRHEQPFLNGLRSFLWVSFPLQPSGYAQGVRATIPPPIWR
jgi:hypothetical protein